MGNPEILAALDGVAFPLALLRDGAVAHANAAFARAVALGQRQLQGSAIQDVLGALLGPEAQPLLETLRRGSAADLPEEYWLHPDRGGRRICLRFSGTDDGQVLVAVIEDEDSLSSARLTEELVAAAATLWRVRDEQALFEAAADALHRLGFAVEIRLVDGNRFIGGTVRPGPPSAPLARIERAQLPAWDEVLVRRCMAYDLGPEIHRADGSRVREGSARIPIFAWDQPVAVLKVERTPLDRADAAALELFGRHLGAAAENVRHHLHAEERLQLLIQLQRELVQHERLAAVGETSAVFTSEMRGPLGAIMNAIALLRRDAAASPNARLLLGIIDEETQRLDTLINDLFHSTAPLTPRRFRFDLAELAHRVMKRVEVALRPSLSLVGPDLTAPLEVDADPELLQLAIENLVRNAIHICPPESTVQVSARLLADGVALRVDDSGPGIPEAELSRIFEPFFTTRASGAGLGLAVVRRIVEAHHGRISVGRSPLGGACFELFLP